MENKCMQDEGVDCSSGCMRAFVWDLKISKVPNGVPQRKTTQNIQL